MGGRLRALAGVGAGLSLSASALAADLVDTADAPLSFASVAGVGTLGGGSVLAGYGSRMPVSELAGQLETQVGRFGARSGYELSLRFGSSVPYGPRGALGLAADLAAARWPGGSWVVGLGAVLELGEVAPHDTFGRGAPVLHTRLRLGHPRLPAFAAIRVAPISTDAISGPARGWAEAELAAGPDLLRLGLRYRADRVAGGDPHRVYFVTQAGPWVGILVDLE